MVLLLLVNLYQIGPIFTKLDLTKFRALADIKIIETTKLNFDLDRVENVVGKGENASDQHFLLSPSCFQKTFFLNTCMG